MMSRILLASFIAVICMANAKEAVAQNREGTYGYRQGENASGEIRVSNVNARSFRFRIGIGSRNPACVGEFSNRANWIAPNVAEYRFGRNDHHACRLVFIFSGNDLIVRECACDDFHGASCNFEGIYTRLANSGRSRR
jgi:hypothetical protein